MVDVILACAANDICYNIQYLYLSTFFLALFLLVIYLLFIVSSLYACICCCCAERTHARNQDFSFTYNSYSLHLNNARKYLVSSQVMCVQYWPASKDKDEEYGGIGVSVLKEEEFANFHIRTIKLYKKGQGDEVS